MGVHVLYLVKYNDEQKAAMVEKPAMRERAEVHKRAIADFGGKPIAQFGSYGEYDMVYIYEMPDAASVAANLHLTDSFGLATKGCSVADNGGYDSSIRVSCDDGHSIQPCD